MTKKFNGVPISRVDFILAWQESKTLEDALKALFLEPTKYHKSLMSNRAALYRRKGVPLKRFYNHGGGGARVDWASLAQLARDVGGEE